MVTTLKKVRKELDATWTLKHGGARGGGILLLATFTKRLRKIAQKLYTQIYTNTVAVKMRDKLGY